MNKGGRDEGEGERQGGEGGRRELWRCIVGRLLGGCLMVCLAPLTLVNRQTSAG